MSRPVHTTILVGATLFGLTFQPSSGAAQDSVRYRPGRALAVALAGTLVPGTLGGVLLATRPRDRADHTLEVGAAVLIGAGALLGPSLGHFMAGDRGLFLIRLGLGGGLMAVAAGKDLGPGLALAGVATSVIAVTAIVDLVTTESAARRHAGARRVAFSILPSRDDQGHRRFLVGGRLAFGRR